MNRSVVARPLILSPSKYNAKTSLAVCGPVTSHAKGYPFEVHVEGKKISGVVLTDQVKSLDWRVREAAFIEKIAPPVLRDVQLKIIALLEQ